MRLKFVRWLDAVLSFAVAKYSMPEGRVDEG